MCNPQAFQTFTEKYMRWMCIDVYFFLHRDISSEFLNKISSETIYK